MAEQNQYQEYISKHFAAIHPPEKIKQEFKDYSKYFRANYLRFLPNHKDAKIVDLGCGMGHFINFLKNEGYKNYLGIDLSQENIKFCKNLNLRVQKDEMLKFLEKNKESFDAIIINDVIEHFKKDDVFKLLRLARQSLKPKGILIIKTLNAANYMLAGSSRYVDITHEISFTEESLRQVCLMVEFSDVIITKLNLYVFYFNPINYPAWLFATLIQFYMRIIYYLHGRKTTRIFTKDLLVVCRKK